MVCSSRLGLAPSVLWGGPQCKLKIRGAESVHAGYEITTGACAVWDAPFHISKLIGGAAAGAVRRERSPPPHIENLVREAQLMARGARTQLKVFGKPLETELAIRKSSHLETTHLCASCSVLLRYLDCSFRARNTAHRTPRTDRIPHSP